MSVSKMPRKNNILSLLLAGIIALCFIALISSLLNQFFMASKFHGLSPGWILIANLFFGSLYVFREKYPVAVSYTFIGSLYLFGTISLLAWGVILPQGLLTYVLALIMSGILISSTAVALSTLLITASLVCIALLQTSGLVKPDFAWLSHSITLGDISTFVITFLVLALVTWLYNHEIEKSLLRAHKSESALKKRKQDLEKEVEKRTAELENLQVERNLELQRFAEFGRLSLGLVHDLANPLTAASINLEQIDNHGLDEVQRARKSIKFMEQYVAAARRQIQNKKEMKVFNVQKELLDVIAILSYRAKEAGVEIILHTEESTSIFGDAAKFSQIFSNLIANAIDSYEGKSKERKVVTVAAEKLNDYVVISVTDRGVGLEFPEKIFDAFYSTKKAKRGIGLGLMLTKQYVEQDFDGTIVATSSEMGTVFSVNIPQKQQAYTKL